MQGGLHEDKIEILISDSSKKFEKISCSAVFGVLLYNTIHVILLKMFIVNDE